MEWMERLNESMKYIEEHLTDEIDYEQLGRIACCSAWHFQRMFTYMAGVTLAEYIRRRKMSLAAVDLQNSDERIIDIAERYGYHSPTAFNRAFQAFHGVAPSAVKNEGVSVRSFSPVRFHISVTGATELDYRIESKEAFRIIGISSPLQNEIEQNFTVVPGMWQQAVTDGTIETLARLMDHPIIRPWDFLESAPAVTRKHGDTLSLSPAHRKTAPLKNTWRLLPPGPSSPDPAPTVPCRNWSVGSSPNGCPLPVTNTPMPRTSKYI